MKIMTERVKFHLSSAIPGWKGETFEIEAYVLDKPSSPMPRVSTDMQSFPHLRGLQLADNYPRDEEAEVDVMLGIEDTLNITLSERIAGPRGTPVAQKSHLGWIVSGTYPGETEVHTRAITNRVECVLSETAMATRHWDLEPLGILPNECKKMTEMEEEAVYQHTENTKLEDQRYTTGLIRHPEWKSRNLTSNETVAQKRLESLERRLQRDPALGRMYKERIESMITSGRAAKVDRSEKPPAECWYLPHQPVVRLDKVTTKVRVVFDGSAKGPEGVSLNDTLLSGPALQPDPVGVLLRFRRHKIALVADIEKMFLQIRMRKEDHDLQRFLWRDMDTNRKPDTYRLTTVIFGLSPSPFSSIQTVRDHANRCKEDFPRAASEVEENMFVDDVITGADSTDDASKLALDLKNLLRTGGFPLKKFLSNQPEALSALDEEDRASVDTVMVAGEAFSTKTLGVKFAPAEDVLMFSFCEKLEDLEIETRRTVLRQLHRIYDPMGLLSPFTLGAKQLFKQAWMVGGEWDDQLPEELQERWISWKAEVPLLDQIKINRCLIPTEFESPSYSLHGFGDACEASYGSVIYIRVVDSRSGAVHTAALCSKTRVAPIGKRRSVPELELMAALITARLVRHVEKEMKLHIDSEVVLSWLRKPSYTWQTFVANRVSQIQDIVEPSLWRHVPGKLNPADMCSRGCSVSTLVESQLWWNGPQFLRLPEEDWPKSKPVVSKEVTSQANVKKRADSSKLFTPANAIQEVASKQKDAGMEQLVERFSNYNKFVRVMATCRSWLRKYRAREKETEHPLDVSILREEELIWLRWVQAGSFPEEIKAAQDKRPAPAKSRLRNLDPLWNEETGLLCVGGRLHRALLPDETKNPIILPTHNKLIEKMIVHFHQLNGHTGVTQTLSNMRSRFWILHGRQELRRVLPCKSCREAAKLEQKMAPLPEERVQISPNFSRIGCDYAGPLYVKAIRSPNAKAYILLFTCMVTRAVHLELTSDMTTEEFLQAFRRMMNRRGKPCIIYSDNAQTFKCASKALHKLLSNAGRLRDKLKYEGIEWKFITPRSPWQGGFYERLVGSVKRVLRKILHKSTLTFPELQTVLTDVEAQINSRPLCDVSADKEDPLPLTPGHLLTGRNLQLLPSLHKPEGSLEKRWAYQQRITKTFWKRWTAEYLLDLQRLKKWTEVRDNIREDDVVLVAEDNLRKFDWCLGRVVSVHPGRDGLVRSATVKTKKGLVRRPIQKLRMLEARSAQPLEADMP